MSIIFMFVPEALGQQRVYPVTIVNGVVTDSVTNEPLEYVNIYLKGSDKGCMTDEYGRFSISTDANFTSLQATLMGYDVKEIFVDKGRENMLRLQLSPTSVTLQEVTVNATKNKYSKKNNPAVELMERIRSHKRYSDPRRNDYYSYDKYEKTVLALNDFSQSGNQSWITKKFGFIYEFLDTSEVSGKPILPISVKEKSSKVLYRKNPGADKEIVEGYKRGGLDEIGDEESIRRFMEDVFREIDIYDNDITLMQNRFVSPLSHIASNYYKFYLDTVSLMGKRCLELSFSPHNRESFGFSGRLFVALGEIGRAHV